MFHAVISTPSIRAQVYCGRLETLTTGSMNHLKKKFVLAVLPALLAAQATASSAHAEDRIVGRIQDVHNGIARACFFDEAKPGVGARFELERRVVGAHPKGETMVRPEKVGLLLVTAEADRGHCATAEVTKGSVREADWVVGPSSTE